MDYIPLVKNFLDYGTLGIMLVITMTAIVFLFRLLMQEKEKRISDSKEVTENLMEPIKELKDQGQTQITLLRQFLDK